MAGLRHMRFCVGFCLVMAVLLACPASRAHEVDLTRLPLGDDKISDRPRVGWIWPCRVEHGGGGARIRGPWIRDDGTFDATAKAIVDGDIAWPNRLTMSVDGGKRLFSSNALPDHGTGMFPVAPTDDAYKVDMNPNEIREHDIRIELPLEPVLAPRPTCAPGAVGILLTGAALFNGLDAMGRDAVAHEVQDACQGHPEFTGTYHYHSVTTCIEDKRSASGHSALLGYALDGFGIFGRYGEGGEALSSADLDECHGHQHAIEWNGRTVDMYHYHGTQDFPYTVGCLRGANDIRAVIALVPRPQRPQEPRAGAPDLAAAALSLGLSTEQLMQALGRPPPDFPAAAKRLGIPESELRKALRVPSRQ